MDRGREMNYFRGLTTFDTPGLRTINVGFQPIGYKITCAQKFGVTDTIDHVFIGGSDGTRQHVAGHFHDSTGRQTFTETSKVITQKERTGGLITEVLRANHDSMQPTGPRVNVITPTLNYQVVVEAWA